MINRQTRPNQRTKHSEPELLLRRLQKLVLEQSCPNWPLKEEEGYINRKICGIKQNKSTWLSVENVEVETTGEEHGDQGCHPVHGKHGEHTQEGPQLMKDIVSRSNYT